MKERLKWIIFHPIHEIVYLLGGVPKEHIGTLHYRNIGSVVKDLRNKIKKNEDTNS